MTHAVARESQLLKQSPRSLRLFPFAGQPVIQLRIFVANQQIILLFGS
jgi:hypothetical protein